MSEQNSFPLADAGSENDIGSKNAYSLQSASRNTLRPLLNSLATGYSYVRFKVAGSDEYSVEPTVDLYDYGMRGISFNNLNDGQHKNEASPGAADIISIQKIDENTTTNWAAYLVKGKIHTTVLKNVYESAAGEMNRDYTVNGSFVIHAKIYF